MTEQLGLWGTVAKEAQRSFRPIHYLGSKFRLLREIEEAVLGLDPGHNRICDLFSGSGVVAAQFSARREVVAVDIQEYSRVLASALLAPGPITVDEIEALASHARTLQSDACGAAFQPLIQHESECLAGITDDDADRFCDVLEHGSLFSFEKGERPNDGLLRTRLGQVSDALARNRSTVNGEPPLAKYFGGVYFSYEQALALQCCLAAVNALPPALRDTGLAATLSTASELVSTVGNQFAQPVRPRDRLGRPKQSALRSVGRKRSLDAMDLFARWLQRYHGLPAATGRHEAIRADYRDFLSSYNGDLAVVYADPPYTRDHYSRFYHVLETLARQDDPGVTSTRIAGQDRLSRGLYRTQRHQSPFCIKSQAAGAFSDLFTGVRRFEASLVVSYSPYDERGRDRPRLMMMEDIVRLARRTFRTVDVLPAGAIKHSKLNAARLNNSAPPGAEVFVVCVP